MDKQELNLKYTVNMDVIKKNFKIDCKGKIGKEIFI